MVTLATFRCHSLLHHVAAPPVLRLGRRQFARKQQPNAAKLKEYDDRLARERKEVYPQLRRVDMTLNGLFAVRFNAE